MRVLVGGCLVAGSLLGVVVAPTALAAEQTPAGVAMTFYLLANQGRCTEAEGLFTPEAISVLKAGLGSNGFMQFCQEKGGESQLVALSVKQNDRVSKDEAQVELVREYELGLAIDQDTLVKVKGAWKIAIGGERRAASKPTARGPVQSPSSAAGLREILLARP